MRTSLLVAAALCISLSSCANKIATIVDTVTTSTAPAKAIFVAENAFNVAKKAADGYVVYCTPNPTPAGCNIDVIVNEIAPAIQRGTTARTTLDAFLKAHPGEPGAKGVYDALVAAKETLTDLLAKYDKR